MISTLDPARCPDRDSTDRAKATPSVGHNSRSGDVDFSLVVPTYNERENLAPLLQRLGVILANHRFEVILVDDDSPDQTWAEAQVYQHRYPWLRVLRRRGERGLSSAVVCGFRHARGKILGVMDADLQHDATRLPELLRAIKGVEFAVATRRSVGGSDGTWSWARRFVSHTATLLTKIIARIPLSDPMSGFFVMRRELFVTLDDWALQPRGYKVLVYLYGRALQCLGRDQVRVHEVGYEFAERQSGQSKFSARVVFDFILMLCDLRLHRHPEIPRATLLPARS